MSLEKMQLLCSLLKGTVIVPPSLDHCFVLPHTEANMEAEAINLQPPQTCILNENYQSPRSLLFTNPWN